MTGQILAKKLCIHRRMFNFDKSIRPRSPPWLCLLVINAEESRCVINLPYELLLDVDLETSKCKGTGPDIRRTRCSYGSQGLTSTVPYGDVREAFFLVHQLAQRTRRDVLQELRAQNGANR